MLFPALLCCSTSVAVHFLFRTRLRCLIILFGQEMPDLNQSMWPITAKDFKETMRIVFDEFLPQWNYTALPSMEVI